jgi:histone deacetylase complex regulatory component SIN3
MPDHSWIKHIITDKQFTVAIKYCPGKKIFVIGGRLKFHDYIRKIRSRFRVGIISTMTHPNHVCIRYQFECVSMQQYEEGLRKLENDDTILVQSTQHLGRIMR